MEDNFRNTLIIISTVIIGAIFVHGLWTIRKNKNPYKLKAKKDLVKPTVRDFDRGGFDQDGVGQVKKRTSSDTLSEESLSIATDSSIEPSLGDEEIPTALEQSYAESLNELETASEQIKIEDVEELELSVSVEEKPVYQEPVTQAKPVQQIKLPTKKAKTKDNKIKRNQMEINFGDGLVIEDEPAAIDKEAPKQSKTSLEPEFIVLSVVMPQNQVMSGAALLPSLLTLGLKYGEMNIFHRHQDNAGNGKVTFSLANMVNPGTFDLDTMETFATQGISLFMTLPNVGDPFEVFEQMLSAAKQLAQEFQGQLLDDKRSVMTKQTEQHYVSKIREFDRKSRIAAAE